LAVINDTTTTLTHQHSFVERGGLRAAEGKYSNTDSKVSHTSLYLLIPFLKMLHIRIHNIKLCLSRRRRLSLRIIQRLITQRHFPFKEFTAVDGCVDAPPIICTSGNKYAVLHMLLNWASRFRSGGGGSAMCRNVYCVCHTVTFPGAAVTGIVGGIAPQNLIKSGKFSRPGNVYLG
jgi:hypothetical protein